MNNKIEDVDLFQPVFLSLPPADFHIWISVYYCVLNGSDVHHFCVSDRHFFLRVANKCMASTISPDYYHRPAIIEPNHVHSLYDILGSLRIAQDVVMTSLYGNDDVQHIRIAA